MAVAPGVVPRDDLWPLPRREYDLLVERGGLAGQPVELLDGVLVRVPAPGPLRAHAVAALVTEVVVRLRAAYGRTYGVRTRMALAASDFSEPEPDLAVVDRDRPRGRHPATAHLVAEVTDDRPRPGLVRKPRIYAGAAVPAYWFVDMSCREVAVHTVPGEEGYARVVRVPFDAPLDLLGLTVTMDELLA